MHCTRPVIIGTSSSSRTGCSARSFSSCSAGIRRHLFEFHNQVFDHAELNARVARKTISIFSNLPDCRPSELIFGKHHGLLGQHRPVAHVDHLVEGLGQEAIERVVPHTRRRQHLERQVSRLDATASGKAQDLRAEPDADDGRALLQALPRNLDFLRPASAGLAIRQRPRARRPAETGRRPASLRAGKLAGRERAEILEANAPAFEMIFYQAKVLACRVLDDGNHVHRVRLVGGKDERVVAAFTIGHG